MEHLLREVPGRMVIIWDGSPIHRSHTIQEFLANGASQRLHLERLPAYAPELNPDEGFWQQLKGVELRNVCCFDLRHLRELGAGGVHGLLGLNFLSAFHVTLDFEQRLMTLSPK